MRNPKKTPTNKLELDLLDKGFKTIIGIDEAGRGAWAGPVVVGAYKYTINAEFVDWVRDSKLLTAGRRINLYNQFLKQDCISAIGGVDLINKYNVTMTIQNLINEIVEKHTNDETFFLIDGVFTKNFGKNTLKVIKGDRKHYSISAGSIVAKVTRDKLMEELHKIHPEYGFEQHKGYGTEMHHSALILHGISKYHRMNYKPIVSLRNQLGLW